MDLEGYLRDRRRLVEDALERHVPKEDTYPEEIHKAVRYSVFSGGKRLRPILTLAATEAVGGDAQIALPFACAIEFIHTYSLIHDDLPAMDDDDLRRGKPTSHKAFGEAIAILAGDALNTDAFNLIARQTLEKGINPALVLDIIIEITDAAGLKGMVTGQVLDLEKQGRPCTPQELDFIHQHKTASLITASVRVGAMLGGARPSELEALTLYGRATGLAFQIVDDLLDVEGGKEWGKVRGRDNQLSKATYPALHGLEASRSQARKLSEKACAALDGFDHRADPLRSLAEYIVSRSY
jgi:geranylgeranyl diphosphate synthase type II